MAASAPRRHGAYRMAPVPATDSMMSGSTKRSVPAFAVDERGDRLALRGTLDVSTLVQAAATLQTGRATRQARTIDLRGLDHLDTPGALVLRALEKDHAKLIGVKPRHRALLDLVCRLDLAPLPRPSAMARWRQAVIQLGRAADEAWHDMFDVVAFVGRAANAIGHAIGHPRELRLPSISRQVAETGVDALPIVGLLAVMISVVIAYQGVAQLRAYGGEDLTIDLVAVSVLREMGVLITAIMVAGRSGAAFTAEIGVMKAREEIDALQVMGLAPMEMLVVPRLIAIVITLPLLTFYADIMGLAGGAAMANILLDATPMQYLEHVRRAVDGSDLFVGLFKAPVFAFVIGVVGCMHGLRVKGSAESVGRETTRAVVKAIFLVIVLDALFSILFERLGL